MKNLFSLLTEEQKIEIIVKIGMDNIHNTCSLCHKQMDVKDNHIQLCKTCRRKCLDKINEELKC